MAVVAAALRKSLVMCSSVGPAVVEDGPGGGPCWSPCPSAMEIGRPTNVRHIAHVTFDRFDGFLGLPVELEPEVSRQAPSASANVFGVSAESMQCSYDSRGNSVPIILLAMQRHLYLQGGLQVEGIFRINAENSQEINVRDQLNRGIVPHGVDLHCLAGLIKAWFRELPKGVLDSLTPDQVMHCNDEEQCSELVRMLPPTEAALLDWAINLMVDVVEYEHCNKMNARNIAMVFAPNMTQMADPLTALIHAVQVMNFLKTLIVRTLREREELATAPRLLNSCSDTPTDQDEFSPSQTTEHSSLCSNEKTPDFYRLDKGAPGMFLFSAENTLKRDLEENFCNFGKKSRIGEEYELISRSSSTSINLENTTDGPKSESMNGEAGVFDRLSLRKGVRKLCRHPLFQLSRSSKKFADHSFVESNGDGREACA